VIQYALNCAQPQITGNDFQQAADFLSLTVAYHCWPSATVADSIPIGYLFA